MKNTNKNKTTKKLPRSPSCGCREIYDGSFSGKKIPGKGLFAQALADAGIPLKSAEEIENI